LKAGSRLGSAGSRLDFNLLADIQSELGRRARPEPESPDLTIRCSSGASLATVSSNLSPVSAPTPEWDNNFMDWVTYEKVGLGGVARGLQR
jgi:hypothetical protein